MAHAIYVRVLPGTPPDVLGRFERDTHLAHVYCPAAATILGWDA